jgi:beta-hydroxylase
MNIIVKNIKEIISKMGDKHHQFVVTQGEKYFRKLEGLLDRHSLVENQVFFDCRQFDWVINLEENWLIIRQELDGLLKNLNNIPNFQDISPDQLDITQDHRWKTFFFYAYGLKAEQNCQKCPQTTELVEQIPGMKTAFFSILLPHKHIPEHCGPYKGVIRYHLALKVPHSSTDCQIRVGNEIRHWQEGKSLIFDDTFPHEAWNKTNDIRVVLFVDFLRPLKFPLSLVNQFIIKLVSISPYVQKGKQNLEAWKDQIN